MRHPKALSLINDGKFAGQSGTGGTLQKDVQTRAQCPFFGLACTAEGRESLLPAFPDIRLDESNWLGYGLRQPLQKSHAISQS